MSLDTLEFDAFDEYRSIKADSDDTINKYTGLESSELLIQLTGNAVTVTDYSLFCRDLVTALFSSVSNGNAITLFWVTVTNMIVNF